MKKIVLASLLMACLPYLSFAQSSDDDLYFIPKKKTEKKAVTTQSTDQTTTKTTNVSGGGNSNYSSTVVVKSASGKGRDVDEYNRRYTSKDNTFSMDNDTLYIEEKPYNERGEWVNGFEGSQDDYEYAMRIVRFRNPRYAIPVSSPLYWDVLYALPSWEWNVYDDGFYAYAFPTYSNRLWWDWRWNYPYGGGWGFNSWYSPYYYNSWYSPSWGFGFGWGGPYYGHNHYWGGHNHWGGGRPSLGHGGWNRPGVYDNRRAEYRPNRGTSSSRVASQGYRTTRSQSSRVAGRVVNSSDNGSSVRPSRVGQTNRGSVTTSRGERENPSSYTRPSMNRGESSYSRPSSTRSSVRESGNNALNRSSNSERSYNSSRSSYQSSGSSNSSYRSSSSGSSSRSSYSGGSSSGGGGARRR